MALENPTWGAPRIHGELRMLGFEVSERSVSRCLPRRRPPPGALERWLTFLRNHRGAIAAMDFSTVPTATFRVLYVWFAIAHSQRRILHLDVTEHPTASWVVQQLREAFPYDTAPHYLVFDRDAIFSARVVSDNEVTRHPAGQNGIPKSVAEGQGRVQHRPHSEDSVQRNAVRILGSGSRVLESLGDEVGGHPHSRHHQAARWRRCLGRKNRTSSDCRSSHFATIGLDKEAFTWMA